MAGTLAKTDKPLYKSLLIGFSDYLQLGEPFSLRNGNKEIVITMYISPKALQSLPRLGNLFATPKPFIVGYEEELAKFSKKYYEEYKEFLTDIFSFLIRKYKGFPSATNLTKRVWFIFDISNFYQAMVDWSPDYEIIQIKFSVNSFNIPKSHRINTLLHELLHIISEVHHGEDRIRHIIDRYNDKLENAIKRNEKVFRNGLYDLIGNLSNYVPSNFNNPNREEFFADLLRDYVNKFFTSTKSIFWNFIADAALCVIAIELDNFDFIKYAVSRDSIRIGELRDSLISIKELRDRISSKENNEKRKEYLLQILKLIQFMTCTLKMPVEGIAYGVLGEGWRPVEKEHSLVGVLKFWSKGKSWHRNKSNKNVDTFKSIVTEYCDPDVSEGFLRFFQSYMDVVSAQAIHNDPLNPDITKQIFDTECLKRGKRVYRVFNQEYYKLYVMLNELK